MLCAQENLGINLLPSSKIFPVLKANYFEPRMGLAYYPSTGYFKVDAGNSVDIFHYNLESGSAISFGGEFFVHALGLNVKQKRLPIDAADGYFGLNFAFQNSTDDFNARLRIIHNSAHLVDGHIERNLNYRSIVDYVKDFAEITLMRSKESSNINVDYYAGGAYSIVIHPKNLKRYSFHGGAQVYSKEIVDSLFNNSVSLFCAYHFSLTSVPKFIGNNRVMAGVRFGNWNNSALTFFVSYYSGANLFNQYYNQRENQFSVGFYLE